MSEFDEVVSVLVEYGKNIIDKETDALVEATTGYPVSFVLCCLADKNIRSETAWSIHKHIKDISFDRMTKFGTAQWIPILDEVKYIRVNKVSEEFCDAIKLINEKYGGKAERIWEESNSFSEIICKFLEFKGIGIKIATMAAILLNRHFGVNFEDKNFMDVAPDTHVRQVFNMLGFVDDANKDNRDIIIYRARALYPEAPYMLDKPCYEIGKNYCVKNKLKCDEGRGCPVRDYCKHYADKKDKN